MSFLFNCSKYILIPILSEWLNGKELLKFEASLCSYSDKDTLQRMLRLHPKVFQNKEFPKCTDLQHVKWLWENGLDLAVCTMVINDTTIAQIKHFVESNDRKLKSKFCFFNVIKSLTFIDSGVNYRDKLLVKRLLQCFPNVQEIECLGHFLTVPIANYCTNLMKLKVMRKTKFPHLENVLRANTLVSCDLSGAFRLDFQKLILSLAVHCTNLSTFILPDGTHSRLLSLSLIIGFKNITEISCKHWSTISIRTFLMYHGAKLRSLDLYNTAILKFIKDISSSCLNLTHLNISYCSCQFEAIGPLILSLKVLQYLNIKGVYGNSPYIIETISRCFSIKHLIMSLDRPLEYLESNIEILEVIASGYSPQNIPNLLACTNLHTLHIESGMNCCEDDLNKLPKSLRVLNLEKASNRISFDKLLRFITSSCKDLKEVHLREYQFEQMKELHDIKRNFSIVVCGKYM